MTQYYEMDIPRLCTALAHWLGCVFYLRMLPPRWGGARRAGVYAGSLAVFALYLTVTDGYNGWLFNLLYVGAVLLMLLFFCAASRSSVWLCGYFCARAFILAGFASALIWQFYCYFARDAAFLQSLPAVCVFVAAGYALVFGCMWLLENSSHAMQTINFDISPRTFVITAVMAMAIYVLSSISYTRFDTPFTASGTMEIYSMRTIVYFGGVALLFAYHLQICDLLTQLEADALRSMLQTQYDNYRMRQESIDLINQKYHDLKHQIAVLRTQSEATRDQALDRMEQEIRGYEAQIDVGNKVLGTVLTGKVLTCQSKGIQLTSVVDGAALSFMDDMDLSNLFGNALDNAIEGCEQLDDPQKRLISLCVARQKGFVAIRVENCFEGTLHFKNGLPLTTKQDSRYHGFGIKSIQAAARKYGGSVTVSARGNWFELHILLPVPEGN